MTWLNRTHFGDCRESMRRMIAAGVRVNCVVTSPPYWGLRDYGVPPLVWGGRADCNHAWGPELRRHKGGPHGNGVMLSGGRAVVDAQSKTKDIVSGNFCQHCDAWRGALGLEPDLRMYVTHMVEVFALAWQLLADDGVLWLNLGDSYAGSTGGLPEKNLCMIPARVAIALQEWGWYLRQEIIWSKPNPMPESVTDRCTKAHEQIFLLTKRPKYFFDSEAIAEPAGYAHEAIYDNGLNGHGGGVSHAGQGSSTRKFKSGNKTRKPGSARGCPEGTGAHVCGSVPWEGITRNKRSVWTVTTKPFKGAHFATFPPDLIEPCILAGTSAHGHCYKCGAGWERITEKGAPNLDHQRACGGDANGKYRGKAIKEYAGTGAQDASATKARILEGMRPTITVGWQPTCDCGVVADKGIVFDPFGGSGTTAQVAQEFGRHWILCELNPDYESLQQERTRQIGMAL